MPEHSRLPINQSDIRQHLPLNANKKLHLPKIQAIPTSRHTTLLTSTTISSSTLQVHQRHKMSLSSSRWAPARPSSSLKSTSTSSSTNAPGSLAKDIDLANPPSDSISALSFSPAATSNTNFLAVASWDNTVKIYDVSSSLAGEGKAEVVFDRPVLDCAWSLVSFFLFFFRGKEREGMESIGACD